MEVRQRQAGDIDELASIAAAVHSLDRYPPSGWLADISSFLSSPNALGTWVAVDAGSVVGHIALHPASAAAVMAIAAEATGWPMERLAAVARLFVTPTKRRCGVGRRLVDHAVAEAHRRERWPVLDVAAHFNRAIALYESCGWSCAGPVTFQFSDGTTLHEAHSVVYLGPRPPGG
jgi:GNAT superfamily N-acetyltransferase